LAVQANSKQTLLILKGVDANMSMDGNPDVSCKEREGGGGVADKDNSKTVVTFTKHFIYNSA
jgi:hypothetical protein